MGGMGTGMSLDCLSAFFFCYFWELEKPSQFPAEVQVLRLAAMYTLLVHGTV